MITNKLHVNIIAKCNCPIPAGVGRVRNVGFDKLFTAVMWDPPLTAGTLDSLYYGVIVVNGVGIVSITTTMTTQLLPDVQLCHEYIAKCHVLI